MTLPKGIYMLVLMRRLLTKILASTPQSFPYRYERTINGCEAYVLDCRKFHDCVVLQILVDEQGGERYGSVTVRSDGTTHISLDELQVAS